jgi:hypothetical protein
MVSILVLVQANPKDNLFTNSSLDFGDYGNRKRWAMPHYRAQLRLISSNPDSRCNGNRGGLNMEIMNQLGGSFPIEGMGSFGRWILANSNPPLFMGLSVPPARTV